MFTKAKFCHQPELDFLSRSIKQQILDIHTPIVLISAPN